MYSVAQPTRASHCRSSLATNSGPLSERMCSGTPRCFITSAKLSITSYLPKRRATRIARHSRLNSSSKVSRRRPQPHTRAVVEPQPPARPLLLRHLQPFPPPDPLHPVLAHLEPGLVQQRRHPAVAVAPIVTGQRDDRRGQRIVVDSGSGRVALRPAALAEQPAGPSFTQLVLCARKLHRAPAPRGA